MWGRSGKSNKGMDTKDVKKHNVKKGKRKGKQRNTV